MSWRLNKENKQSKLFLILFIFLGDLQFEKGFFLAKGFNS